MTNEANHKGKMDLYFLLAITAVFFLVFVLSFSLSKIAGTVPKLISGIGIVLCVFVMAKNLFGKKPSNGDAEKAESVAIQGVPVYKSLLLLIAYLVGMIILGFPISTFIFLAVLPIYLGNKNYRFNVIFSLVSTAVLYFVFVNLFYVRLPVGVLLKSLL